MFDVNKQREERMAKRIGKVYGVYKVVEVQYDFSLKKQKWTLECVKCGRKRETYDGKDFVKGRLGNWCECMKVAKKKKKTLREKVEEVVGKEINGWRVLGYEVGRGIMVECVDCGRVTFHKALPVLEGRCPKCTCKVNQKKYSGQEWLGNRYGRLVVIGVEDRRENDGHIRSYFKCQCDCGNVSYHRPIHLINGDVLCCGEDCKYKNETIKTANGESKDPLYRKRNGMIQRCYNPNSPNYEVYGGRGIKVCDEWKDNCFAFRDWSLANGWKEGLTIDRIDPDGNYCPENCRYITLEENSARARKTTGAYKLNGAPKKEAKNAIKYEVCVDGYVMPLKDACSLKGKTLQTILYRIRVKGMSPQEAFDTPNRTNGRKKFLEKK